MVNTDFQEDENAHGYDVCKSYSSVLISNDTPYPIFREFDEPKPFNHYMKLVPGEYYINIPIILCDGLMKYPKGFYPLNFTNNYDLKYFNVSTRQTILKARYI